MNELRPTQLDDIVGQEDVINILRVVIASAKQRSSTIPHIIFDGNAGTGKTTLALALANEFNSNLYTLNAGNINSVKDIMPTLCKLDVDDLLFIDEIHRLDIRTMEFLYPVMEDFKMDMGKLNMQIPKFTLIGATTELGKLSKPMHDRFTYKLRLNLYNDTDLARIITFSSAKLKIDITEDAALNLARRSRGTPRIANNLILWVRDYCLGSGLKIASKDVIEKAASILKIDKNGVTEQDRTYLAYLKTQGVPVGLNTISDGTGLDKDTITGIIEPWLMRKNLIQRTQKGRIYVGSYKI